MKIELKKISFNERMSDETNCFVADIYIDGKKVGYCKNDGRGGCTEYHGNTKADNELIEKAEAYCKTLPHDEYGEQSFEDVINDFLDAHLKGKEEAKRMKLYMKGICFGIPNGMSYQTVSWKGRVLAQIDKISLQRAYNDVKAKYIKGAVVVLNAKNLEALGVNL